MTKKEQNADLKELAWIRNEIFEKYSAIFYVKNVRKGLENLSDISVHSTKNAPILSGVNLYLIDAELPALHATKKTNTMEREYSGRKVTMLRDRRKRVRLKY